MQRWAQKPGGWLLLLGVLGCLLSPIAGLADERENEDSDSDVLVSRSIGAAELKAFTEPALPPPKRQARPILVPLVRVGATGSRIPQLQMTLRSVPRRVPPEEG